MNRWESRRFDSEEKKMIQQRLEMTMEQGRRASITKKDKLIITTESNEWKNYQSGDDTEREVFGHSDEEDGTYCSRRCGSDNRKQLIEINPKIQWGSEEKILERRNMCRTWRSSRTNRRWMQRESHCGNWTQKSTHNEMNETRRNGKKRNEWRKKRYEKMETHRTYKKNGEPMQNGGNRQNREGINGM